ncbi:hypothetical protein [Paenibacillus baimaensis]|nr:hypothetical protein [Paenibacillus sp. WQ 127069]
MLVATHMAAASAMYVLSSVKNTSGIQKAVALPVILALSLCSHFALDAVPHFELQMLSNVLIGSLIILFLLYIAWRDKDVFVLVSAFLGALPDVMWVLKISHEFDEMHSFLHSTVTHAPPYSIILELLALASIVFIIYKAPRKT